MLGGSVTFNVVLSLLEVLFEPWRDRQTIDEIASYDPHDQKSADVLKRVHAAHA